MLNTNPLEWVELQLDFGTISIGKKQNAEDKVYIKRKKLLIMYCGKCLMGEGAAYVVIILRANMSI